MLKEFRDFVLRGNVVDLAVAVIIGGAFNAIVGSLVADIITPALLQPALEKAHISNIAELSFGGVLYGKFLAAIISFIVVAFVLFLIVKGMNAAVRKKPAAPAAPPVPSDEVKLLMEIRDLLKK